MMSLELEVSNECNRYLIDLASFLDKVCSVITSNENIELTKTYISEFGDRFDNLVRFIRDNYYLCEKIFKKETDLKFALHSFEEALHNQNFELCNQILKYELKYILSKWQSKLRIER